MHNVGLLDERQERILLVEYGKAQDSAEHHERLGWQARSILWASSFLLIGYSFTTDWPPLVVAPIAGLGILLVCLARVWDWRLGKTKQAKYNRCKEIERRLGMAQHSSTQRDCWKRTFAWIITVILVATWGLRVAFELVPTLNLDLRSGPAVQIHVSDSQATSIDNPQQPGSGS